MDKLNLSQKIFILFLLLAALTGCSRDNYDSASNQPANMQASKELERTEESTEEVPQTVTANDKPEIIVEPITVEVDWSDYFEGLNGAVVIYDPAENCYQIYHPELALRRRSPCSTFKIISSFIALEHDIIEPDDSVRTWSGEIFWNSDWNRDINFSDAFRTSCVWYFREVVDEIGADLMQEALNLLQYGNCDISDWEGRLNTNNQNPALTGFWIESSLLISPKEQTEVMERIFGEHENNSEETQNRLKQVMLLSEQNESGILIYGKTGMGKAYGIVVDSWFTGFADAPEKRIYFCVYLGETNNAEVSSAKAREIAVNIVSAYLESPL